MKSKAFDRHAPEAPRAEATAPAGRRRSLLLGAGVAGAAAIAAKTLPITAAEAPPTTPKPDARGGGGYQVSQHVLRYYETTKV